MSIDLQVKPGQKYIELGGGAHPLVRPNVDTRICHDADGNQTVDFTADFNEPLPIQSGEWDGVFCQFCLEHISYRNTLKFLKEVHRILKPGGKFVCVTSNTQAQIEWARNNPNGWDGRDFFESVSGLLFGDLDYPENSHKAYFSPSILESLFHKAGFTNVKIQAYGARDTDLCVEGSRPKALVTPTHTDPALQRQGEAAKVDAAKSAVIDSREELRKQMEAALITQPTTEPAPAVETQPPAALFDKFYFNGGAKVGGYAREGYRDFHCHEITARKVLLRRPSSVLEIGAARGYVGKRLEDAGVRYLGLEVSKHCYMTRVVDPIKTWDILQTPWSLGQTLTEPFDLSFSIAVLEHVPEDRLPAVLRELGRLCKSHLHGIDFGGKDDGFDRTHRTLRPLDWWKTQFSNAGLTNYEIVDKEDLERGDFPRDVMEGDGKVKVNVGCVTPDTLIHTLHGYKPITDVRVGDLVLTHRGRYRRVVGVSERPHRGAIHRISVLGMGSIRITSEHPVLVTPDLITQRGTVRKVEASPKQWVDAKDVRRGHFTFYPHEIERLTCVRQDLTIFDTPHMAGRFPKGRRGHVIPRVINKGLCRLLGYYIAEGDAGKNGVSFAFHQKEKDYIADVRDLGLDVFGAKSYERERSNNGYELVFSHKKMSGLLREMGGKYSHSKALAPVLMGLPANLQREIIVGAVRGDGTSIEGGGFAYGTTSVALASQMKFLLYRQGIAARVLAGPVPNGGVSTFQGREIRSKHTCYHVRPQRSADTLLLGREIFPNTEVVTGKRPPTRVMDDGVYGYVRDVSVSEYDGQVWNLEVEEDNTYVTEIGVVHNSFTTMFHHGWVNMDCIDLTQFAQPNGYKFLHHDARNGLPFNTGGVDLIMCCHMLEHLSYKEGLTFLRECRRVLKPGGAMRIIVPDLALLVASYSGNKFDRDGSGQSVTVLDITEFDELNLDAGNFPTDASKLWNLLCSGHQAGYDCETLGALMHQAGLHCHKAAFRKTAVEQSRQILRETLDVLPCLSLYVDGVAVVG